MKPYSVARQGLSAVEAFREVIFRNQIEPESIKEVIVRVPTRIVIRIDHPKLPENRLETIPNIRYLMALGAFVPKRLLDVKRKRLLKSDRVSRFMRKVHIKPSKALEREYPMAWSAKVEVKTNRGKFSYHMRHPKGDSRNRLSRDEVAAKFKGVTKHVLDGPATKKVIQSSWELDTSKSLSGLLKLLE